MTLSLSERKLRVTRDALVEAALELFSLHGYEETTVEQVAAAAGVSPRTFFRHFATKQDIFFVDHPADLAAFNESLPERAATMSLPRAVERAFEERRPVDRPDSIRLRRLRLLAEIPSVRAASYLPQLDYEEVIADVLLRRWTTDPLRAVCTAAAVMAALRRVHEAIAADPEADAAQALESAYRSLEDGIGEAPVL
jgi:AcrR family transcriptional regulator